jgi:hypothetical protein
MGLNDDGARSKLLADAACARYGIVQQLPAEAFALKLLRDAKHADENCRDAVRRIATQPSAWHVVSVNRVCAERIESGNQFRYKTKSSEYL